MAFGFVRFVHTEKIVVVISNCLVIDIELYKFNLNLLKF